MSKYVVERADCGGFTVRSKSGRRFVLVTMSDNALSFDVWSRTANPGHGWGQNPRPNPAKYGHLQREDAYIGFPEYQMLLGGVARGLLTDWEPHTDNDAWNIRAWAERQTKWSVGKRVTREWQRMKQECCPPDVLAVQNNCFSALFKVPHMAKTEELYAGNPWFLKDLGKYRAAAVALENVRYFIRERTGDPLGFHDTPYEVVVAALEEDWMGLFSPDGRTYRALNSTLMNLPGGVPASLLRRLSSTRLVKPYHERAPLVFLLGWLETRVGENHEMWHMVQHATPREVKACVDAMTFYTIDGGELSWRRAYDITRTASYMADYPGDGEGTLLSFARAAVAWHEEIYAGVVFDSPAPIDMEAKTVPPDRMPEHACIEFLDTVGRVHEESDMMHHCVRGYADAAVKGETFLFHIERGEHKATLELGGDYRVRQVKGPCNSWNGACAWASRFFEKHYEEERQALPQRALPDYGWDEF